MRGGRVYRKCEWGDKMKQLEIKYLGVWYKVVAVVFSEVSTVVTFEAGKLQTVIYSDNESVEKDVRWAAK